VCNLYKRQDLKPHVKIYIDLGEYEITKREVLDMAYVLAEAYPDEGKYVSSFGFLTYKIERTSEHVVVEVYEGWGYHGMYGFEINMC